MLLAVLAGFMVVLATGGNFGGGGDGGIQAAATASPANSAEEILGAQTATAPADVAATRAATEAPTTSPSASPPSPATALPTATPPPTLAAPPSTAIADSAEPLAQDLGAEPFTGTWRIVDTVTSGAGEGAVFTFDVVLTQAGSQLRGGGNGIQLGGTVNGATASVMFSQSAPRLSGTFEWTLTSSDRAVGTFSANGLNNGTSELISRD